MLPSNITLDPNQGCVDIYGDHCRVVPVGFPPNLRPEQLKDWEERIQQQAQWVAQNKVSALAEAVQV